MPDLKVYVNGNSGVLGGKPKYYSAAQVEGLQRELADTRTALEEVQHQATESIAAFRQEYPARIQFVYGMPKYERPFLVRALWNDGQFTYIKSEASELPALYEVKDGAPELVNFQVHGDTYVVPKVLDRGYLVLGKDRFQFARQGR
jgi:type IV secretion system protein VirB9